MINLVFKWIYEKQQISLLSRKRTSICLYWCGAVVFYWTPVATWRQHIPSSLEAACVWHTKRIRMCTHWDLIKALCGGHSRIQTGGRTRWVAVNRSYIRQMFQGPQLNRKRNTCSKPNSSRGDSCYFFKVGRLVCFSARERYDAIHGSRFPWEIVID